MKIEGPIPFKSSTDQAIASLYFMRISSSLCSSSTVNLVDIIIGLAFSGLRKHTSSVWIVPSRISLMNLFLFLLPSLYCSLLFLYCSH